jgi:hypothetical protein
MCAKVEVCVVLIVDRAIALHHRASPIRAIGLDMTPDQGGNLFQFLCGHLIGEVFLHLFKRGFHFPSLIVGVSPAMLQGDVQDGPDGRTFARIGGVAIPFAVGFLIVIVAPAFGKFVPERVPLFGPAGFVKDDPAELEPCPLSSEGLFPALDRNCHQGRS